MAVSTIQARTIIKDYNIENNTSVQILDTGLNVKGFTVIGLYTMYNSWVDSLYNNSEYFGNLILTSGQLRYTPNTAGVSTKIRIMFVLQ